MVLCFLYQKEDFRNLKMKNKAVKINVIFKGKLNRL